MATLACIASGRGAAFGPEPLEAVQTREAGSVRDARDSRVAEALARAIRGRGQPTDGYAEEILAKVVEDGVEWGEDRTDLASWCLRAWLASRVEGGDAWFRAALPALERAPAADGVIPGRYYWHPTARTAAALLILLEGRELRPPFDG
jgi:hypothetical protein